MRPVSETGEKYRHAPVGGGLPRGRIEPVNEHERAQLVAASLPGHFVGRGTGTATIQGQTGRRYVAAMNELPAQDDPLRPGDGVTFDVWQGVGGLQVARNVRRAGDSA